MVNIKGNRRRNSCSDKNELIRGCNIDSFMNINKYSSVSCIVSSLHNRRKGCGYGWRNGFRDNCQPCIKYSTSKYQYQYQYWINSRH